MIAFRRLGMRTLRMHGFTYVMIASHKHGPLAELALAILRLDHLPLIFEDSDGVPAKLRNRKDSRFPCPPEAA
jgi:hypothetical protein